MGTHKTKSVKGLLFIYFIESRTNFTAPSCGEIRNISKRNHKHIFFAVILKACTILHDSEKFSW